MAVGREEVEIVKPRSDKREYRRIVLENSLEVLLIGDPETDKCAASMDVGVGHFSDPPGIEGLAHFLEHMLFYASEKYPEEDSFDKYTSQHGGGTNALTGSDHTNYHFVANADCFEEALDRFSQFFVKPLMLSDAVKREIKAVDSEFQKNFLSDSWRIGQLWSHLSMEAHPYHKFGTGNRQTLEVQPKAKGIDIRQELIKFYEENYSANLMHLVVYGKVSLDKIQDLVVQKFNAISNNNRSRLHISGDPCSWEHLQVLVRAVPICDDHTLQVQWPIPCSIHHYKEVPCGFLTHLIGHEGEGSLFHALKRLGWATSLSAYESFVDSNSSFFNVFIEMTDAGNEHMQDIVGLLFKYIGIIHQFGICEWIYNEIAAVSKTMFHNQDKISPMSYVVSIASHMKLYPPKDWLVKSSLPSKFNPSIIRAVLERLSSRNFRIFWVSKNFEGETNMVEPWYATAYCVDKLNDSTIQEWMQHAPSEHLRLPVANQFIATDLSLKKTDKVMYPVLLRKTSFSTLWYKPDTAFSVPKATVHLKFNCPYACNSPHAELLARIFKHLVFDYLNEYAYYAELAGLYYGICRTDDGFELNVSGYNHKLRVLLDTVLKAMADFTVKPERFSVIKEKLTKSYQNFKFDEPRFHASYYRSLILNDHSWPWEEDLEILETLKPKDLSGFAPTMLSRAFLECYIAGNIERNEAESIVHHIEDVFFNGTYPISKPALPSQLMTSRLVTLDEGASYVYSTEGLNPNDENSALIHYIQIHQDDIILNVRLQLLAFIARHEAFHQLRTVEQLGYVCSLTHRYDLGVHGLQFTVQSAVKCPKYIDTRVQSFLKSFESKLSEMSKVEFESHLNALIESKMEKDKNLWEECERHWEEITDRTFLFDRVETEVAALRELTKQELIAFFHEHIRIGAPKRKVLSVRVYGSKHSSDLEADKNEAVGPNTVLIDDIFSFRASQPLYGSPRRGYELMEVHSSSK
ncbi:insulin-degrading enzyme-like 1, peroxisomal isoform X2 [Rhodamnia argentea]|uniref:Insulin-degrading enzyme-like 1, peroxisomal isoform X2 n=2 Tax=Rhodamnia argentea TaxID=178133 RepID=A0ABM3HZL1_9MYRT|nr:insulin-degrading enzyme-like 1, peroxisomal isoform X2 [Rhodamnia argentea]